MYKVAAISLVLDFSKPWNPKVTEITFKILKEKFLSIKHSVSSKAVKNKEETKTFLEKKNKWKLLLEDLHAKNGKGSTPR